MRVVWMRRMGGDKIVFDRPFTYFVLGIRGSEKSSLLEHVGEEFIQRGSTVLDLFGSRDGEGLAWCRSEWAKDKNILLLHGDNTKVASEFDSKNVSQYRLSDLQNYDIIVSAGPLYSSPSVEYEAANKITDLIYQRRHWKRKVYMIVREASNLYYSRLKAISNQAQAKAQMIYLIREARHMGYALGLDTLKYTSIDLDVRVTVDYMFFKSQGMAGLPADLKWVYRYLNPFGVQSMPKGSFVVLTKAGSLGIGIFPKIPWHKEEGEDILRQCGIDVEHGEELEPTTVTRIGDLEHSTIIEGRLQGKSYMELSGNWSVEGTRQQVVSHNKEVKLSGECSRCRKAKSSQSRTIIPSGRPSKWE